MGKKETAEEREAARKLEGAALAKAQSLNEEKAGYLKSDLAGDMGVTGALITQWMSGQTRIPDIALLEMGAILSFDPYEVRPSLDKYRKAEARLNPDLSSAYAELTPAERSQVDSYAEFLRNSRADQ